MTRPDLDELAALAAKATPGPYYWFMRECADKDALIAELTEVVDKTDAINGYNLHGVAVGEPDPYADYLAVAHTGCGPRSPANAQLIVAAVNALPALLAYIAELERDREAAALAMRERCAQVCEALKVNRPSDPLANAFDGACETCAAAIRALEA